MRANHPKLHPVIALLGLWLWLATGARADYIASLQSDGSPTRSVRVGEEFPLDVQLASDATNRLDSAEFRVWFSGPGLRLTGYDWSAPFVTGGKDDASIPAIAALPSSITANLVPDEAGATNRVDVYFSNLATNLFRDGRLLRLRLLAPTNYAGLDTISVQIVPEAFGNGFSVIPAKTAQPFVLRITPASGQPQSALSISLKAGVLSLSWPASIEGAKLQTASASTGTWSDVLEPSQLANGQNGVQLPFAPPAPKKFFRLKLP